MSANLNQITEANEVISKDLDGSRAMQRLNDAAISAEPKRQPQPEPKAIIDKMTEAVGESRQNNKQSINSALKEKPKLTEVTKGLQQMKSEKGEAQKGLNNSTEDKGRKL